MALSSERIASQTSFHKIDCISLVEMLHGLSSLELSKIIKESERNMTQARTSKKLYQQFRTEDLGMLPMHLMARLLEADLDQAFARYFLSGLTLLHKLYSIAPHHPKLEQMLLDDIHVLRQSINLIFYVPIVLNNKLTECSSAVICLHSTIVAGSLYLLRECVSPDWPEVAYFLSIHPMAYRFMEAVFVSVHVDLELLQKILSDQVGGSPEMTNHHCQQCEASLQCIYTLCQQKPLEDYLVKHKVLYGKNGILLLVQCVLNLNVSTSVEERNYVSAAVSRMKSKVLSIFLYLCELDSICYLDEVAKAPGTLRITNTVALKVIELLKTLFSGNYLEQNFCLEKNMPKGLLQLNAMRIADVLSDDTNFRSYMTMHITDVLATLLLLQHEEFVSIWCVSNLLIWEEDGNLEYDPFVAAGWVLNSLSDLPVTRSTSTCTYTPSNLPRDSYPYHRTSLLVKLIANLHCFAPDIYKDEKDVFLNSLFSRLQNKILERSHGASGKDYNVCKNICSLLTQAESLLINDFLSEEDVHILRLFVNRLIKLMTTADML